MILMNFKQEAPGDHVPLEDVLKALKIEGPAPQLTIDATSKSGTKEGAASAL